MTKNRLVTNNDSASQPRRYKRHNRSILPITTVVTKPVALCGASTVGQKNHWSRSLHALLQTYLLLLVAILLLTALVLILLLVIAAGARSKSYILLLCLYIFLHTRVLLQQHEGRDGWTDGIGRVVPIEPGLLQLQDGWVPMGSTISKETTAKKRFTKRSPHRSRETPPTAHALCMRPFGIA